MLWVPKMSSTRALEVGILNNWIVLQCFLQWDWMLFRSRTRPAFSDRECGYRLGVVPKDVHGLCSDESSPLYVRLLVRYGGSNASRNLRSDMCTQLKFDALRILIDYVTKVLLRIFYIIRISPDSFQILEYAERCDAQCSLLKGRQG